MNNGGWTTIYSGSALSLAETNRDGGTYTYRVQGCNSICSGWTTSANLGYAGTAHHHRTDKHHQRYLHRELDHAAECHSLRCARGRQRHLDNDCHEYHGKLHHAPWHEQWQLYLSGTGKNTTARAVG